MGLFDGRSYSTSDVHSRPVEVRRKSSSHSHYGGERGSTRGFSPARSATSGNKGYFVRPAASSRRTSNSFFGGFGGGGSRGIFGGGSSAYRRSPRSGYISYLWHKLQRMVRELWEYARRHPMKAFFAVVVPLVSAGGAIHGLMKQFGVRIPGMSGGGPRTMRGGYYGSRGYGGGGGFGSGGGLMENAGSLFSVAKAFM